MPTRRHPSYQRLLRDPRWQRKRLAIFQRDHWACQQCGATHRELHVHHRRYHTGVPWACPNRDLVTLCRTCHLKQHRSQR